MSHSPDLRPDSDAPFLDLSPWLTPPADRRPALEEDLNVDVAVVGGGYTGLSTALELRAQGADVAVLEQDFAGSGASGRNAGHLTPTIGKDAPTLLRWFGRERAGRLVRFADAAVEHAEETIRKLGIECDYRASGNVLAAVHPAQADRLRGAAEAARSVGARVRFMPAGEMRERGLPAAFASGVLEERGGTLDPGRLALGLRRAALAAGVRLFEGTPVRSVEDGRALRIATPGGALSAGAVVVATNGYGARLAGWRRGVTPLRVSLFETAPLGDDALRTLGWQERQGVYTAHEVLESYRLTARGTLVGGSKWVGVGWGGRLPEGRHPRAFRAIARAFRERFPELVRVPIAHYWGGWIGLTTDFLPVIRVSGRRGRVVFGGGFAGHGVAQGLLLGAMLAERVQGRPHSWEPALARRVVAWPPEPLRWLGGQAIHGALRVIDARTDRRVRRSRR